MERFHRADLYKWESWKRERLVEDLCAIIRAHVSAKTGVTVINNDLQAHVSAGARKNWRIRAYSLAGRTAAKEMRIWASEWGGPIPELVFEEGDLGRGDLAHLLESQGYPSPIFKPNKTYVHRKSGILKVASMPLQAADLLVYKIFAKAQLIKQHTDASRDFSRIHPVLDKIPGMCGIVTPDHLRFIEQGMNQIDSLVMTTDVKIRTG